MRSRVTFGLAAILLVCALCGCSEYASEPVLAHGRILTDNDDLFVAGQGCHAYVKIINTSSDDIVAETKVTDIQYMPKYYEIRKKYNEAFTNYWDDYVIRCELYMSADDNTIDMQCTQDIDISSYDRNIDLEIK